MADKLEIYRGALRLLGPHEIASLAENRPERLKLDEAWAPAVTYMLEKGLWNFAIRTMKVSANVGASYGLNIAAWPQRFAKALEAYLAFECGLPITDDRGNRNDLYTLHQKRLADAKILDAVDERVRYKPAGRVVRARFSGRNGRDG